MLWNWLANPNSKLLLKIEFHSIATLTIVSWVFSIDIMSKKLDPEGLGIILLNAFMDEFFPEEKRSTPDTFDLLHYNGIPRSNVDDKVRPNRVI